eukprot:scaffold56792_cov36-Phaeocystis_antarctica.AAC.1
MSAARAGDDTCMGQVLELPTCYGAVLLTCYFLNTYLLLLTAYVLRRTSAYYQLATSRRLTTNLRVPGATLRPVATSLLLATTCYLLLATYTTDYLPACPRC